MQAHRLPPPEYRKLPGMLLSSEVQRKAVFARDGGVCAKCGVLNGQKYQADHIMPLHLAPNTVDWPERAQYWRLENLQTMGLVCGCAQKKTAREAKDRAKTTRILKKAAAPKKERPRIPFRPFCPVPKKSAPKAKKSTPSRHKPVVSYL